jgi:hypothetical protein
MRKADKSRILARLTLSSVRRQHSKADHDWCAKRASVATPSRRSGRNPRGGRSSASRALRLQLVLASVTLACAPGDREMVIRSRRCERVQAAAEPVGFRRVDLERSYQAEADYVPGPQARAVVFTQREWADLWQTIAPSVRLPTVVIGNSALVVVASGVFRDGPTSEEIVDVCRSKTTGAITVLLQISGATQLNNYPDRSIQAVLIDRRLLDQHRVDFVDLPARTINP